MVLFEVVNGFFVSNDSEYKLPRLQNLTAIVAYYWRDLLIQIPPAISYNKIPLSKNLLFYLMFCL